MRGQLHARVNPMALFVNVHLPTVLGIVHFDRYRIARREIRHSEAVLRGPRHLRVAVALPLDCAEERLAVAGVEKENRVAGVRAAVVRSSVVKLIKMPVSGAAPQFLPAVGVAHVLPRRVARADKSVRRHAGVNRLVRLGDLAAKIAQFEIVVDDQRIPVDVLGLDCNAVDAQFRIPVVRQFNVGDVGVANLAELACFVFLAHGNWAAAVPSHQLLVASHPMRAVRRDDERALPGAAGVPYSAPWVLALLELVKTPNCQIVLTEKPSLKLVAVYRRWYL